MKRIYVLSILVMAFFMMPCAHAKKFGSDRISARQKAVFFPSADNANELVGFSSFAEGIILGNDQTEVSFDALFPMSGSLVLNGGKVKLKK